MGHVWNMNGRKSELNCNNETSFLVLRGKMLNKSIS